MWSFRVNSIKLRAKDKFKLKVKKSEEPLLLIKLIFSNLFFEVRVVELSFKEHFKMLYCTLCNVTVIYSIAIIVFPLYSDFRFY